MSGWRASSPTDMTRVEIAALARRLQNASAAHDDTPELDDLVDEENRRRARERARCERYDTTL